MTDTLAPPAVTEPVERSAEERSRAAHRISYEPALDGIRGASVLAIMLYHADISWMSGAIFSVDAFFVLSGFLITSLLVAEWRGSGTIHLKTFWVRRARRLLPALLLLLLGIIVYAVVFAQPTDLGQLRRDGIATLVYGTNWEQVISGVSYFDQFADPSPLRHAWTLAIEEQYYLLWPLVVTAFFFVVTKRIRNRDRHSIDLDHDAVVRRTQNRIAVACGVGALTSAAWMAWLYNHGAEITRLYFGTDTRVQSILVGAGLGAFMSGRPPLKKGLARTVLILLGLLAVGATLWLWVVAQSDDYNYQGGFLIAAVLCGLMIAAAMQGGRNGVKSVLGIRPLVYVGLISYGVYLWHWPIYQVITTERTGLGEPWLMIVRLTIAFALAMLSFYLIEQPVRRGALKPRVALALVPLTLVVVAVGLITSTGDAELTQEERYTASQERGDEPPEVPQVLTADIAATAPEAAPVSLPQQTKVLLVGDSVGWSLGDNWYGDPTNPSAGEGNEIRLWNRSKWFCEMAGGSRLELGEVLPPNHTCDGWQDTWREAVDDIDPDVSVLLTGYWELFDRQIDGRWVNFGTPTYDEMMQGLLQDSVDVLSSGDTPVVFLTMAPPWRQDADESAREWTPEQVDKTVHFNNLLRQVAEANPDKVTLIDLGEYVCPGLECQAEVNGVVLRPDWLHYDSPAGAKVISDWLTPQLRQVHKDHLSTVAAAEQGGSSVVAPEYTKALLVGDSVAWSLGYGYYGDPEKPDPETGEEGGLPDADDLVRVWNRGVLFCELVEGARLELGEVIEPSGACTNWRAEWADHLEQFDPDVSIAMFGAWEIFDRQIDGEWVEFASPEYDAMMTEVFEDTLEVLGEGGRPVVYLTLAPGWRQDDNESAREWTPEAISRTKHFNELLHSFADAHPEVHLIDLQAYICPDYDCPTEVEGIELRTDGVHYDPPGAQFIGKWLEPQLREIHLESLGLTEQPGTAQD